MKKLLAILFVLMAFGLVMTGCDTGSNDKDDDDDDPVEPVITLIDAEGNLNLELMFALDEEEPADNMYYDEAEGGVVCTFADGAGSYADAFFLPVSVIPGADEYTKVTILANVYEGATLVNLASEWGKRIYGKVDAAETGANYNMGVENQSLTYSAAATTLNFGRKVATVTKIVITGVIFSN